MEITGTDGRFIRPGDFGDVSLLERPGEHRGTLSTPQSGIDSSAPSTRTLEWTISYGAQQPFMCVESWDPMAEGPELFHYFAREVKDEESALDFFRNYGPLFWNNEESWTRIGATGRRDGSITEPVYDWLYEASLARIALERKNAIAKRDFTALAPPRFMGKVPTHQEILREAECQLLRAVTDGLRSRVSPRMKRDPHKIGGFALEYSPVNLLGAVWLLFAFELTGNAVVKQCDNCLQLFSMTEDSHLQGRRFCSDKCRNQAWRRENRPCKKGGESNDKTE